MNIGKDTPTNTITRDLTAMSEKLGNVYEMVAVIGKRANQVSVTLKKELDKRLQGYTTPLDSTFEEVFDNREQADISRRYEKMPKPTLIATQEYIEGRLSINDFSKENAPEK